MSYQPSVESTPPVPDEQLVRQAQRGELESFNILVERYQKGIFNLALRMLRDYQSAEDATQDAFTSAYTSIKSWRGGNFRAWLYRIAANVCYDVLRRNKRRPWVSIEAMSTNQAENDLPLDPRSLEDAVLSAERLRSVSAALAQLPDEQRLVLVLFDIQGFSYQEVSEITKISVGTVKSRISRARAKFRDIIKDQRELFPEFQRLSS